MGADEPSPKTTGGRSLALEHIAASASAFGLWPGAEVDLHVRSGAKWGGGAPSKRSACFLSIAHDAGRGAASKARTLATSFFTTAHKAKWAAWSL